MPRGARRHFAPSRMKYNRALEYVLENAPVRAKDPEKKVRSSILKAAQVLRDE